MGLDTGAKLTALKSAYALLTTRNKPQKSRNRVLAATERERLGTDRTQYSSPATGDFDIDATETENASPAETLEEWAAALESVEDADEATIQDTRREVPAILEFDFAVPALPELARRLPATGVAGYPQEVVWRLHNFRNAKLPLRYIVGRVAGDQFVVDMCALMREHRRASVYPSLWSCDPELRGTHLFKTRGSQAGSRYTLRSTGT